jgi:hypothetical protein
MKESFGDIANFLDDLVPYPINKMAKKERVEHRQKGVPFLARRLVDYGPSADRVLHTSLFRLSSSDGVDCIWNETKR